MYSFSSFSRRFLCFSSLLTQYFCTGMLGSFQVEEPFCFLILCLISSCIVLWSEGCLYSILLASLSPRFGQFVNVLYVLERELRIPPARIPGTVPVLPERHVLHVL